MEAEEISGSKRRWRKKLSAAGVRWRWCPKSTFFDYLGHNFHTEILCCPKCGEVYLPEALVKGRMADVERELEDK